MTPDEIIKLAKETRDAQKAYFKTRGYTDRPLLIESLFYLFVGSPAQHAVGLFFKQFVLTMRICNYFCSKIVSK